MTTTHATDCRYAEYLREQARGMMNMLTCDCPTTQEAPMPTPLRSRVILRSEPRVYGCGCRAYESRLDYCPTHAQAFDYKRQAEEFGAHMAECDTKGDTLDAMRAVLQMLVRDAEHDAGKKRYYPRNPTVSGHAIDEARALLRAVEG